MPKRPSLMALIVAAGSGQRARVQENEPPKQYCHLDGEPLINWSLKVCLNHPHITHVQVVYDSFHHIFYEQALAQLRFSTEHMGKLLPPILGGQIRQESVHAGLRVLARYSSQTTAVLIHDAARPFITEELINRAQSALTPDLYGVIPIIPIVDTIKRVHRTGIVSETLPRDELFRSQTPQIFWFASLLDLHNRAQGQGSFTDDSALVEKYGFPVGTFPGDPDNIKITTALDFKKTTASLVWKKEILIR